jgi:hypothetical protein
MSGTGAAPMQNQCNSASSSPAQAAQQSQVNNSHINSEGDDGNLELTHHQQGGGNTEPILWAHHAV